MANISNDDLPTTPLVSVVMPVHNGERYLDQAISSILNQTLKELELIIVVNGSIDSSVEIASQYAMMDSRVRVVELAEADVCAALNRGIDAARAKWVARMDCDDIALPERLERQVAFLDANPDVAAVGSYGWMIGANGKRVGMSRIGPTTRSAFAERRQSHKVIYLLSPSVIFARDVALALGGFHKSYALAQDIELWTRIADNHEILVIPEPLVCYRIHESSASARGLYIQMQNARLIKLNSARRRSGQTEISLQEFREIERHLPWWRRLDRWRAAQSLHYYRRGGARLAIGSQSGLGWLALSAAFDPLLPIRRLRRQRVLQLALSHVGNAASRSSIALKADS